VSHFLELSILALSITTPQVELGSSTQLLDWHSSLLEQILQGAPAEPQAVALIPDRHWLPSQQPVQLLGPHCWELMQTPCWQVSPALHALQVWPPWPQSVSSVPDLQVDPEQQPLQLAAEQAEEEEQAPRVHVSPPGHWVQAPPPVPQAAGSVPERQTPPSQQPLQVAGPQPQLLLSHFWLAAQVMHGTPPEPQASSAVPGRQLSPWQQPPAQLPGLHWPLDSTHWPWAHTSPCWHSTQGSPTAPQAEFSLPCRHWLPWQQPLQLPGRQPAPPSGMLIPESLLESSLQPAASSMAMAVMAYILNKTRPP